MMRVDRCRARVGGVRVQEERRHWTPQIRPHKRQKGERAVELAQHARPHAGRTVADLPTESVNRRESRERRSMEQEHVRDLADDGLHLPPLRPTPPPQPRNRRHELVVFFQAGSKLVLLQIVPHNRLLARVVGNFRRFILEADFTIPPPDGVDLHSWCACSPR